MKNTFPVYVTTIKIRRHGGVRWCQITFMITGNNNMKTMPSCGRLCTTLEIGDGKLFAEAHREQPVKHILQFS